MCGRFTQDLDGDDLETLYELNARDLPVLVARWNGAPTQEFALCRVASSGLREVALHRWGLVPAWAKDSKIGARLINARSESVDIKPSFRNALRHRRCLVPASGWFEWQKVGNEKRPWWISLGDDPFSFAGLWEMWDRGGGPIWSFTILTCPATGSLQAIHHRQPSIVPRDRYDEWLEPGPPRSGILDAVRRPRAGPFSMRRVGPQVNNVRNDRPEILRRVQVGGA